jgi:tRNA(adenine34) deaminase
MIEPFSDEHFMRQALNEAKKAVGKNEVAIGAVIVAKNQVIARGHNLTEQLNDVTAHAEMQAITAAAENVGGKYLKNCTLYVTMEPCVMCAGALNWSQISKVVFGAYDERRGACRYDGIFHPKTEIVGGLLEGECSTIVKDFFKKKR